jgi:drug/metabolite transporter (DMT)-like permease
VAIAFLGGVGFALFAYAGLSLAPAAHGAVLLHGTLPLFTFLILKATSKTQAQKHQSLGIALIAAGIGLMAWDSFSGASTSQIIGDGFLLIASICWSGCSVVIRRLGITASHAASVVAVLSMCCFLPVYVALPGKALFTVGLQEVLLQGVFQGVLIGAVSIFIYSRAVASLGAAETALFTTAVPCVTSLAAIPLLSELPSGLVLAGVGVVTVGMIVAIGRAGPIK